MNVSYTRSPKIQVQRSVGRLNRKIQVRSWGLGGAGAVKEGRR